MSGPHQGAGGIRAKDSDRQHVIDALQEANVNGQLSLDECEQRSKAATDAISLQDLAPLLADLQDAPSLTAPETPPPLPTPTWPSQGDQNPRPEPPSLARSIVTTAVAVVLIPVALGIGHIAHNGDILGSKPNLFDADDFATFVADTNSELKTTKVTEAVIYPNYAVVYAIDPSHPSHVTRYYYDGSFDEGDPDSTIESDEPIADLADVDPSVVEHLIDQGPAALGLPDPESKYLIIEGWGNPNQTAIYVYASDEFQQSGYFVAAVDGTLLDAYPPEND